MIGSIAIIISTKDLASMNIGENLKRYELPDNVALCTVDKSTVYCDDIVEKIDAELYIFASKHSAVGLPSLTIHSPGNWFNNDLGGRSTELAIAPALFLAHGFLKLQELKEQKKQEIMIAQECTHHGPTFAKPIMFIEIGSSEEEWGNKKYGEIIAETIQYLVSADLKKKKVAFGIGGTHYTPNLSKLIVRENYAFGHICPKYQLEHLTFEIAEQALKKTVPAVDEVVIDWKGVSGNKERIREIIVYLKQKGVPIRKI